MAGRTDAEFEDLARARTPQLFRSAWMLCGDRHLAEDLVQESLAKVYAKWSSPFGGSIDNPAAYLQTTLTRTFLSTRRRRSSGERPVERLPEVATADSSGLADLRLNLLSALGDLGDLGDADRAVLVLRYLEDLSVEDTAARMGVSPGAVRNRSKRALDRVRPLIDNPFIPLSDERPSP